MRASSGGPVIRRASLRVPPGLIEGLERPPLTGARHVTAARSGHYI
jgi:hypothetical protein